ncbi:methyl-accepting chemotaxis protein [Undibacterium baiyunense]|uniref:MCP four helix bundle domain-containing protein n=1 Tax=Undibacterium baiyunense TaxID=2828731 RepID=A0A941I2W6_9BURK|nr:methyl-accepting chemotaxis protein [Undibacterium baiyunense]MBR7747923.1 MCP four helix bundle domain-containing protein [Undibacterium baiyunense]
MKLNNLKIRYKLGLSFAVVIALMLIVSVDSFSGMKKLSADIELVGNDRLPKVKLAQAIKNALNENARNMRNILLLRDVESQKNEYDGIEKSNTIISNSIVELERRITSKRGQGLIKNLMEASSAFSESTSKFLNHTRAGEYDAALQLMQSDILNKQAHYFNTLDALIEYQEHLIADAIQEGEAIFIRESRALIFISVLAVAIATVLGWLLSHTLTTQLGKAVNLANKVANGDLRTNIQVNSTDEIGQLSLALREMNEGLIKIVQQVRSGTHTIASASSQIAVGNMDLSSRTEEQASSLEETASSMETLTSIVKKNAENAYQASQLADSASAVATRGGKVVSKVVDTMDAINQSSKKIVDIIGVIDGIAFQTNILALNAAVEAARAGEQGRGFAVVASEVRTLAQRSATAAKEIKALIDDSVSKVTDGTQLVDEAGKTMQEIVTSVKRVNDVIGEISIASNEQTAGIEQINMAILKMDEVTQQNASLVEEAAAAAESMQNQAQSLESAVSVFKLEQQQAIAASSANSAHTPAIKHHRSHPATSKKTTLRGKSTLQLRYS